MKIERLVLKNFRNYKALDLSLSEGLNLFYGCNATGKTNLVEAIFLLTEGNSFRIRDSHKLISKNECESLIKGIFYDEQNHKEVVINIGVNSKNVFVNEKRLSKLSELFQENRTICITPKDAYFFYEDPKKKRLFFDSIISKESAIFLDSAIEFQKILEERNALLKNENIDKNEILVFNEKFSSNSEILVKNRNNFIERINSIINEVYQSISTDKICLKLEYIPSIKYCENYSLYVKKILEENLSTDLKKGFTSFGPQKDEFKMLADGEDVCLKCSNGQNKLIIIALKLAILNLLNKDGNDPILILDDIFSEIDKQNSEKLIEYIKRFKQVFITSTNQISSISNKYHVENNRIIKEE